MHLIQLLANWKFVLVNLYLSDKLSFYVKEQAES